MTPNKIISHFHNYLCILIVLKKVTSICNIGTEVQKIFSKSNIIYKMFILQVTKKKKAKCSIVMLVPNTTKDVASYTSWLLFRHFSNIAC